MPRRLTGAFSLLALLSALAPARDDPPPPATLELVLPDGATATADGTPLDDPRAVTVGDLKPNEIRRVKLLVKFADGAEDERLVDVTPGLSVRMAVPQPGPERAAVVGMQPLVPINAAAVSRDGRYIAVGLEDRTVVLWDTAAGRPVRTLAGHQKPVTAVAFSPDGRRLLSGSSDATAVLWDPDTGERLRTYKGHTGAVASAAFAPDGSRFLTGSPDGTAILWETQTGEPVHTLKSAKGILGVAYSPDGATLATASVDYTATLWDAKTGKPNLVLRGHREDVNCVAFSPDGGRVATGSSDDGGMVWDAAAGKRITPTVRHTNNVHSVAFTPDGRRVVTGEREELVMMSDAATGAHVRTFVGHGAEIFSIVPMPDGRTMLTASRDGTARLWDLVTGRELLTLTTDGARKAWAVASPDGLLDGPEAGRRSLGFRFTRFGAELDHFFGGHYRPGLLAEVWRGERPLPPTPLGRGKPPVVKLVAPKDRVSAEPSATLTANVTDQGGGVSGLVVENNGVRLATPAKSEPAADGKLTRFTFTVPLAPGVNRIRARSAGRDGSWESASGEVELTHPRLPGRRGRMYVVAVGVADYAEKGLHLDYPAKDARAIAELLRTRGGKLYERVDVVPVFDREATRAAIEDTVKDVAELTRPQDALVVLLCGHGALVGDRLYFAPHDLHTGTDRPEDALRARGTAVDDVAGSIGAAAALDRALVVDVSSSGEVFGAALKGRAEFGLRGAVERWGRSHGVHAVAAVPAANRAVECPELGRGFLASALLDAAGDRAAAAVDVTDWFRSAADRSAHLVLKLAGVRHDVEAGARSRGFPVLAPAE